MSGFSDMPLTVPQDAEVFSDIFEAKYVTEYLEKYIDDHVYCERSLRGRIKFPRFGKLIACGVLPDVSVERNYPSKLHS